MKSTHSPVGFLLFDVARLMRQQFDHLLTEAKIALTLGEARTLMHLYRIGPVRQAKLARQMSIEPMTLVSFLDRLEERGYILRKPDPGDRRAKIVTMTDAAAPVVKRTLRVARRVQALTLADMSNAESEQFVRLLELANNNLSGYHTGSPT